MTIPGYNPYDQPEMPGTYIDNATGTRRSLSVDGAFIDAAPTLGSLVPATAVVGAANLTMRCLGTGFVRGSVIIFGGGVENTVFVSATEVTTIVKPSTASGAATVQVQVRNPDGQATVTRPFTFTAT
jgi:hypothetical protein